MQIQSFNEYCHAECELNKVHLHVCHFFNFITCIDAGIYTLLYVGSWFCHMYILGHTFFVQPHFTSAWVDFDAWGRSVQTGTSWDPSYCQPINANSNVCLGWGLNSWNIKSEPCSTQDFLFNLKVQISNYNTSQMC